MQIATFNRLTKFTESFFGLPFLFSGLYLGWPANIELYKLVWVLPAFFCARISGMAFNQLIDRKIDAKNPRTKTRVLPANEANIKQAMLVALTTLFGFILSSAFINQLCFLFSFPIAFLIVFYSFTKRFTFLSHFFLGMIHLFCPFMAAMAVSNAFSLEALLLGFAAFCLIAGNDMIYGMQDLEFDRGHLLHSIPVKYGLRKSMFLVRGIHLCTCLLFASIGICIHSYLVAFVLPLLAGLFFIVCHKKCYQEIKKGCSLGTHFFWSNTSISILALVMILLGGFL